jgi:hypothetical protein
MEFEALQYQITMHNLGMGDAYFISQFIKGVKLEIRYPVQGQIPSTMEKVVRLAKIKESIQDKTRGRLVRQMGNSKSYVSGQRAEPKQQLPSGQFSKERQL